MKKYLIITSLLCTLSTVMFPLAIPKTIVLTLAVLYPMVKREQKGLQTPSGPQFWQSVLKATGIASLFAILYEWLVLANLYQGSEMDLSRFFTTLPVLMIVKVFMITTIMTLIAQWRFNRKLKAFGLIFLYSFSYATILTLIHGHFYVFPFMVLSPLPYLTLWFLSLIICDKVDISVIRKKTKNESVLSTEQP